MKKFVIESVTKLDLICWMLVLSFFVGSAILCGGSVELSFIGASGVVVVMFLVSVSIETIIETIKNVKGIGTIIGFITNGPEALCLLVLMWHGDVLLAASTPLGSNIMNPVLLICASFLCKKAIIVWQTNRMFSLICVGLTATIAVCFYYIPESMYWVWWIVAVVVTGVLFRMRPREEESTDEEEAVAFSKWYLVPAVLLMLVAGYFLDPVVSFASVHSCAPKNLIGFLVLATLTSWPEFKSCLVLLKRGMVLAAILNITVSNITNIWLAMLGVGFHLVS
ncbi:sodium:proton exchanger [Candidatus Kuenenbacteria bacterium]|nr:sodium:proton exchanger [Candidatus Kuenenbacteria bacterium]